MPLCFCLPRFQDGWQWCIWCYDTYHTGDEQRSHKLLHRATTVVCYLCLYVSCVCVVQITWLDLVKDFQCHGNISKTCVAECYENHFTRPVLGVWYLVGFAFSSISFGMEFFVSQTVHKETKVLKKQSLKESSSSTDDKADHVNIKEDKIFYLSREKPLLAMYLCLHFCTVFCTGDILGHSYSLSPTTD